MFAQVKKICSLLVFAAFLAGAGSVLTGCGDDATSSTAVTITGAGS